MAKQFNYQEGEIAKEDIYVYRDLFYVDEEEAKKLREDAYKRQRYIFDRDYEIFKKIIDQLDYEFKLFSLNPRRVNEIKKRLPFLKTINSISDWDIRNALSGRNVKKISQWASKYATILFDNYGVTNDKVDNLKDIDEIGLEVKTINRAPDRF